MPRVGIALGTNLGNRPANLRLAKDRLKELSENGTAFLEASVYQTEPVHCPPDSPLFYNTVIELSYNGDPGTLLILTKQIERDLGRTVSTERNAPRVIDVDMLYFGDEIIDTKDLTLPHPRISERRFVLEPLAEIRPDLVLPGADATTKGLLDRIESDESPLVRVPEED